VVAGVLLWPRLFPSAPDEVPVPNVIGKGENQARQTLGEEGFEVAPTEFVASDKPAGKVVDQDPTGDTYVAPGSTVTITVSSGPPEVTVPDVTTQQLSQAKATLEGQGFTVRVTKGESDEPKDQVLSQAPEAGADVAEGSQVTLTVSDGPEKVPDVVGLPQDQAEAKIRAAGFNPVIREDPTSTEPKGTVVDQAPRDGTQPQGADIQLFVSTYEEPTEDPTPTDLPTDQPTESPTATGTQSPILGGRRQPGRQDSGSA
jgi:serine/threonine-protein kinase